MARSGSAIRNLCVGGVAALATAGVAWLAACSSDPPAPVFAEEEASAPAAKDAGSAPRVCPGGEGCPVVDAGSDAPAESGADGGGCPTLNTCPTARDIGRVSGDNNADQQSTQGSSSEWLKIRVSEDSTVLGASLKATFTLVSPPAANFDLFVYYDPLKDATVCTPPTAKSTQQAGISDTVSLSWGEGAVPNGSDDSRTVHVEVRHISGPCGGTAKWTLVAQGNK